MGGLLGSVCGRMGEGVGFHGSGGSGYRAGRCYGAGAGDKRVRSMWACVLSCFASAWQAVGGGGGGAAPARCPIMQGLVVRPLDDWSIRDSFSDHLAWTAASERAQNKPSMKAMFVEVNALQELLSVIDPRNILEQAQKFAQQHVAMQAQVMRGAVVEHEGLQAMAAPKKRRQLALPAPPAGEPGVMQAALPDGKA